ncbi:hypothetical protein K1T71_014004 [Dendrolimus kikuchii]|uniref:Uncharacterized protein n=1 Tax=Dendrolimus kikuchii TaxID=765133 RepID=A0ACC1CGC4_9NEOP|nr:hypothetical protein K1T71_014004 [Dendrolimus kikuchii]
MAIFPIILTGDTLGERHKNLNALVDDAFKSGLNLQELQSLQEHSPVDRLFKIDLASKLRDVDYLMKMLKDDDMLYVSRALKFKWLLENEYQYIMNVKNLEENLYPHMTTTAVNKMRRWISVNLKDEDRCQQFYEYYSENNFDLAIRFLTHCEVSYILNEIPKILESLDPFYLKVFCERSPQVAKIFFDSLAINGKILCLYLEKEVDYYNSLKVVLKADPNMFLDIIEKYFNEDEFKHLSSAATRYIMNNCKDRFMKKTELYVAWLLDVKTIAECLTIEECKEVVVNLARANYLNGWFSYKEVEPLIKRLNEKERSAFKNKVFVEKDVGDRIKEWPYPIPSKPSEVRKRVGIFDEDNSSIYSYSDYGEDDCGFIPHCLQMRCCADIELESGRRMRKARTVLDQLFDEYRFVSFEKTLFDIRKKIAVESSPQTRQYMMLVLVSKTGGRADSINTLLQLLARHVNEPPHVRATIVRSFVKRAFVWRLPQESWQLFLEFAVGLGLDGKSPEAECREGLHAVVLRSLLENNCVASEILSAYVTEFSTLKEYSLTVAEQKTVSKVLPQLLVTTIVNETNTKKQAVVFDFLFQTLNEYKIPIDTSLVVPALSGLVNRDPTVAESLVLQLFQTKKVRRELFLENFMFVSTDSSYLNALRHNTAVLKIDKYVKRALETDSRKEQFLRKLAIYFTEVNGLSELYKSTIQQKVLNEPNLKLARPLALLMESKNLDAYLKKFNEGSGKTVKRFVVALKANSHLARPKLGIDDIGWHDVGVKAIANRVLVCRTVDISRYLVNLIKSPRTAKLAIVLSQRTDSEVDTFVAVGKMLPNVALKCAIKHFHREPNTFKQAVWEVVKPILKQFDFEQKSKKYLGQTLWRISKTPLNIRADYCLILLAAAKKNAKHKTFHILSYIEQLLEKINDECIEDILSQFLQNEFTVEKVLKHDDEANQETCAYLRILIKFILLSKATEIQSKRYERFAEPILNVLKMVWDGSKNKKHVLRYLNEIFKTLRFKQVFFDENYVSCMRVFERVVSWMHTVLPIEMYFSVYVTIHLNMLYLKTIRQCLKQKPDVFKDETKKYKEGIDIVGRIFGNYIAKEVDELKTRYFDTIVVLYGKILYCYLVELTSDDKETFAAVIKGITESATKSTQLLAVYLFSKCFKYYMNSDISKELNNILKDMDNKEIEYFLYH